MQEQYIEFNNKVLITFNTTTSTVIIWCPKPVLDVHLISKFFSANFLAVWLWFYYISDVGYLIVMLIIRHYRQKDRSLTMIIVLLQSADDEEFNAYFSAYMDIN